MTDSNPAGIGEDGFDNGRIVCRPSGEHPGWMLWGLHPHYGHCFNSAVGDMIVRNEGENRARVRMFPNNNHSNFGGVIHGGVSLTFIDVSMFAGARFAGSEDVLNAVTLDITCQFVGGGNLERPLDAVIERIRETRSLIFLRGVLEQGDNIITNFTGIIKRMSPRK